MGRILECDTDVDCFDVATLVRHALIDCADQQAMRRDRRALTRQIRDSLGHKILTLPAIVGSPLTNEHHSHANHAGASISTSLSENLLCLTLVPLTHRCHLESNTAHMSFRLHSFRVELPDEAGSLLGKQSTRTLTLPRRNQCARSVFSFVQCPYAIVPLKRFWDVSHARCDREKARTYHLKLLKARCRLLTKAAGLLFQSLQNDARRSA